VSRQDPGAANGPLWLPSANLGHLHAIRGISDRQGHIVALCGRHVPYGMARVLGQAPPKCRHCLNRIEAAS
jgi:hypothetical protein